MFDIKGGETVVFSKEHRTDAAKFAMEINSGKKAIVEAIKAFFSLRVSIVANEKTKNHIKDCKEKVDIALNKNLVDRVITPQGFDARVKRGKAMDYERQAVIRTWPFKGIMHPGHAALSVKNDLECDDGHTYISWWPSDSRMSGITNHFSSNSRVGELMTVREGYSSKGYVNDKYDELSDRARVKLKNGASTRERQKPLSSSIDRDDDATDESPWGVSADKIYIPLLGSNKLKGEKNKTFFTVFGLHEGKMDLFWKTIENAERENEAKYTAKYKMFSKHKSCVGMVLTALEQGGANFFIDNLWPSKTSANPNYLHKKCIKLQERIDGLNDKSSAILKSFHEKFQQLSEKEANKAKNKELRTTVVEIRKKLDRYPDEKTTREMRSLYNKFDKIVTLAGEGKLTLSELTPINIKIVEEMTKLRESNVKWTDNTEIDFLFLSAFRKVCDLMKKAYKTENALYEDLNDSLD